MHLGTPKVCLFTFWSERFLYITMLLYQSQKLSGTIQWYYPIYWKSLSFLPLYCLCNLLLLNYNQFYTVRYQINYIAIKLHNDLGNVPTWKNILDEILSSGRATLYKNSSDQMVLSSIHKKIACILNVNSIFHPL